MNAVQSQVSKFEGGAALRSSGCENARLRILPFVRCVSKKGGLKGVQWRGSKLAQHHHQGDRRVAEAEMMHR